MYNDKQAQEAIIEAFRELTLMRIPLNSYNVPGAATAILSRKNQDDVAERIYYQINTMILNGMLTSTSDQTNTWNLTVLIHND